MVFIVSVLAVFFSSFFLFSTTVFFIKQLKRLFSPLRSFISVSSSVNYLPLDWADKTHYSSATSLLALLLLPLFPSTNSSSSSNSDGRQEFEFLASIKQYFGLLRSAGWSVNATLEAKLSSSLLMATQNTSYTPSSSLSLREGNRINECMTECKRMLCFIIEERIKAIPLVNEVYLFPSAIDRNIDTDR